MKNFTILFKKKTTWCLVLKHNLSNKLADPGKYVLEYKIKVRGTYHSSSFFVKKPSAGQEAKEVKDYVNCEDGTKY